MPTGHDDPLEPHSERISRRDTLKRIGVVGTVAWATPILSTVRVPAFAQEGTPVCAGTGDYECSPTPPRQCGTSGPFAFCACDTDAEGNQVCIEDRFCNDVDPCNPANGNRDCPDGYACMPTQCCSEPKCYPLCGNSSGSVGAASRGSGQRGYAA